MTGGNQVVRAIFPHVGLQGKVAGWPAALLGLLGMSFQMSSKESPAGDEAATEFPLLAVVAGQPTLEIPGRGGEGIDKRLGVERRLRDACGHMRTGNEGGIAEQGDPTEDRLRRLQIEHRLKQGLLGSGDDRRYLRRQRIFGTGSKVFDDFRPYQRRWYRHAGRRPVESVHSAGKVSSASACSASPLTKYIYVSAMRPL
jgi:hypothetical protein